MATSNVPYQAYKSKRHSRTVSSPPVEPNGLAFPHFQARHTLSTSLDSVRKPNGVENTLMPESIDITNGLEISRDSSPSLDIVLERPLVSTVGASTSQASQLEMKRRTSNASEPTSPISSSGQSTASSVPALSLNGDASEPPSPSGNRSTLITSDAIIAPVTNGSSAINGSPATNGLASPASAPSEAGPSTTKLKLGSRKSSTFRYVPLRAGAGSAPRTSSPLRPAGTAARNPSAVAPSLLATSRQVGQLDSTPEERPAPQTNPLTASPMLAAQRSSLSGSDVPMMMEPAVPDRHQRITSTAAISSEIFVPPQRTSSLPPPLLPKQTSPSPPSSSLSLRIQSPVPQTMPSTSTSTTHSAASTNKAAYRPGFQPRGVYRPRTDDFLSLRMRASEVGRVERTRLERRFEKLVDLHFSASTDSDTDAKGKEKPLPTRRMSSLFELDFSDIRTKSTSELWKGILESRAASANGGKGDIRAAEQRITPWQDDVEVSTCPHCSTSFHPLTNRKHHCRLCGRIICSLPVKIPQRPVPCSLLFVADPKSGRIEEVSEIVDYGVRPRNRVNSLGGAGGPKVKGDGADEKLMKGVRICRECKPVMLRQKYHQEAKRIPAMIRLYEAFISLESEIEEALPQFQELMMSLSNNPDEAPTKEASAARKHLLQCFADYDTVAKRIHRIPCPGGPGSSQERVQSAILTRAAMFLQKNMFPLQSLPKPKKRTLLGTNVSGNENVVSSSDAGAQVIDPDSELARALQPLLEQEALLESFIEEARAHRKFEDVQTLRANLGEIRTEIDHVVARAEGISPRIGIDAQAALRRRQSLRDTIAEVIPQKQAQLVKLRKEHGSAVVGDIKIENIIGGMRTLKTMLWEASVLDPNEGIRFHGLSIPDCQKALPSAPGGREIIPESMLWLLLTGQVPSPEQTRALSQELAQKGTLPSEIKAIVDSFPATLHPMTQLSMGVAALNSTSEFAKAYETGIKKTEYWKPALEDSLALIARLPSLAARIYRNVYHKGKPIPGVNKDLDLIGNYTNMLGFGGNEDLTEYLRLYIALHGDHEGGNVSAHAAHLVGSALADPYLSYSAALLGLAGPLHGLANQEVLRWQLAMQAEVGENITPEVIREYLWRTLKSGQVVPGYGHGVLRATDPRFTALLQFCDARPELLQSPTIKLVKMTSEVAPGVLKEHGKTKNPYPNVDAGSGCLLYHYGLREFKYYTVIFGVSRALGALTQIVWDRALGLPIERPKSMSMDALEKLVKQQA
ncbi:hypothetical protein EW145_g2887 [Phellinidium pouzarii]|uniref:Citrate synthase n=1 Tax=Phellinidium pouzarii TaxID=167371 RepID=A0A4S4L946_9AGAM|nr:hypothetical protein EW145_g2887 [Phellinidium pouzarii]